MRSLGVPAGATVAVQGLGGLGHLAVQYAAKMGYKVVVLSSSGKKEAFAKELGADVYVDGSKEDHAEVLQKLGGAAMVVVTAPDVEGVKNLVGGLDKGGKILILGGKWTLRSFQQPIRMYVAYTDYRAVAGDVAVPSGQMVLRTISVHGWPSGSPLDCEDAIAFAQLKGVECQVQTWPLEKAPEAYEAMASGQVQGRAVITVG